jgi:hypothetical protein
MFSKTVGHRIFMSPRRGEQVFKEVKPAFWNAETMMPHKF